MYGMSIVDDWATRDIQNGLPGCNVRSRPCAAARSHKRGGHTLGTQVIGALWPAVSLAGRAALPRVLRALAPPREK